MDPLRGSSDAGDMDALIRVFSGNDEYHSRKAYDSTRRALEQNGPIVNLRDEDVTEQAVAEALQGTTLFGTAPAVAIERLSTFTGDIADRIVALLSDARDRDIIIWESGKLNARTKIGAFLSTVAAPDDTFSLPAKPWERVPWAERHVSTIARELHTDIERIAVQELVRRAGTDLFRLENELQKLSLFASNRTITKRDICELVPHSEYNTFAAAQALAYGDATTALRELATARREGEDPRGILALAIRDVRLMLIVRDAMDQGSSLDFPRIARDIGLKQNQVFALKKAANAAVKTSSKQLLRLFRRLIVMQLALHTGRADPDDVVDSLILCR